MCVHIQLLALEHFHPPYSPDLTLSDHSLFTYLKNWLESQRFNNNEELTEGVKMWLSSQAYKILFPNTTSASIPAVIILRSG
jgi:hypothetical protein